MVICVLVDEFYGWTRSPRSYLPKDSPIFTAPSHTCLLLADRHFKTVILLTAPSIIFQKILAPNHSQQKTSLFRSNHILMSFQMGICLELTALQRIHVQRCWQCGQSCVRYWNYVTFYAFLAIHLPLFTNSKTRVRP